MHLTKNIILRHCLPKINLIYFGKKITSKFINKFKMELKYWIILLFSLLLLFHPISSYKILIYSQTLTRSHVILNARVGEALAEDGHNVVKLGGMGAFFETILEVEYLDPLVDFSGSSAKGVRKISVPGNFLPKSDNQSSFSKKLSNEAFNKQTIWSMIINGIQEDPKMHEAFNGACEKFLDEKVELMEQLKAEKFDLFIGEQINFCGSGLSHLLAIPIHILLVSCPIQEHVASILGLPYPISFVPSLYGIPMGDRMDIWQRFANLIGTMAHGIPFLHGVDHLTRMFRRKFGNNFPDIRDIVKESPLIFVNVDEFVDFPRPLFPNIIYIGGLGYDQNTTGKMEADKLPQKFENEMAKGKNGIVFFSLGSAVNTEFVPEEFKRNLFAAFAKLRDWHFLVKINAGDEFSKELANGIENVFPISSWAPQRAILAHPRTKLFITHGGYNSLMESALAGCPILSIGFFADQRRNGMVAERNGWGLAFEKEKLLEGNEEFQQKMLQILTDQKFMKGAKRLAKLLATKPFSARQMLIRHIRFLEENGGKLPELMAESRNMDTISLYNLDILALGFAFVGICIFCFIIFCRFLYLCYRNIRQQIGQLIVKKKKTDKND